jgi:hypothetical protein
VEGFVEHYGASVFYCPSCDGYEAKGSRLSAFAALPQGRPRQGLGDPKGLLTTVLTYHVVEGQLTPDQLADCHKPLQGGTSRSPAAARTSLSTAPPAWSAERAD